MVFNLNATDSPSRRFDRNLARIWPWAVALCHSLSPRKAELVGLFPTARPGATPPKWLKSWEGDGILARVANKKTAEELVATGLPMIDLRGATRSLGVPLFGIDNQSVTRHAFDHLAACGLRNFAFVGEPTGQHIYDDERRDAFSNLVQEHGSTCHLFGNRTGRRKAKSWEHQQQLLAKWLTKLPKPVGVMCCHDDRGQQVLDACQRAGLGVPDEVAVIGVDNDEFLCRLSIPSLSSVNVHAERIGYHTAELVDCVMNGEKKFDESVLFEADGVVARQSTDIIACDDPEIAKVLRFIRQNACNHLTVNDVERQVQLSRSLLNRRFKKHAGHTPKQEIQRVQLKTAKRLLISSHNLLQSIAEQCGFNEAWYFISVFRKETGMTPGKFRKKHGRIGENTESR